jgi:UDP-N-acetylmuramate dehydrogenase
MALEGSMTTIAENIPLKDRTTICTGGPARYFATCNSEEDVKVALLFAKLKSLPVLIMGGGSNLLIPDEGFPGIVLDIMVPGVMFASDQCVTVGAGVIWDDFVADTCRRGLCGVETLSGIPGRIGAAPIQNVGAYGQEVSHTITRVKALNRETLETREFSNQDCKFAYRHSLFKTQEGAKWIILSVTFQLNSADLPTPSYEELQKSLVSDPHWNGASRAEKISLIRAHVLRIRSGKGMVLDPHDLDSRSVGSFFVNPIVDASTLDRVVQVAVKQNFGQKPVFYPAGENLWKLSAAWLIEKAGISKGQYLGRARVSTKHVLALTNPSKTATTADVLALALKIQHRVEELFGIKLVREPVLVSINELPK